MVPLGPYDFPPSRAEQKRTRKREAQRKYRRGVRLRKKGLDDAMAANMQSTTAMAASIVSSMAQTEPHGRITDQTLTKQQQQQQHSDIDGEHRSRLTQTQNHAACCQAVFGIDNAIAGQPFHFGGNEYAHMYDVDHDSRLDCPSQSPGTLAGSGESMSLGAMYHQGKTGTKPFKTNSQSTKYQTGTWLPANPCHAHHASSSSSSKGAPTPLRSSVSEEDVDCGWPKTARTVPKPSGPSGAATLTEDGEPPNTSTNTLKPNWGGGGFAAGLQGCTPLFQAVLLGNLSIVAILMRKNGNPNTLNEMGQTVLHVAAREGHADIVDLLLKCGANPNACDSLGNTPLHMAVVHGWEHVVESLIDAGANVDIVNRSTMW